MKTTVKARKNLLSALALSTALLAGGAQAADATASTVRDTSHRGFFLGLNVGGGGSQMMFKDGSRHITEEPLAGGLGQLRVGYDLSRHFAVGVESIGFTSKKDDNDWELGAVLATVTWRPCDKGFFLRAGVGVGGGDFTDPTSGVAHSVKRRAAALFGLGYEWKLGERFGLGLAADGFGFDADGVTGYEDDEVGAGGATVQFNWYL